MNISMEDLIKSLVVDEADALHLAHLAQFQRSSIDASQGQMLDDLGDLVGQPRNGVSDTNYKVLIKARAAANNSSGLIDEILDIFKIVTKASNVYLDEIGNAEIILRFDGTLSADIEAAIHGLMNDVVSGGVGVAGIIPQETTNFTLKSLGDTDDSTKALGDVTQTFGGTLTYIITS